MKTEVKTGTNDAGKVEYVKKDLRKSLIVSTVIVVVIIALSFFI